eukprot:scaffold251035_cov18-Prasinocladus_malaysianus.AAC.1
MQCDAMPCKVLCCAAKRCIALRCNGMEGYANQYSRRQCDTTQHGTIRCGALQYNTKYDTVQNNAILC